MKTTFSRTFFPAAMILLAALLLVGTSFYALVRNYLTERTIENLKSNCEKQSKENAKKDFLGVPTVKQFYIQIKKDEKTSSFLHTILPVRYSVLYCILL